MVSSAYGLWYDIRRHRQPPGNVSHVTALSTIYQLLAAWYHFRMDYASTEVKDDRRNRILASAPLLVIASSRLDGPRPRVPLPAIPQGQPRTGPVNCAMADVLAEPLTGMLQPVPGQAFGPDGPLGGIVPSARGPWARTSSPTGGLQTRTPMRRPTNPNAAITDSAGTAGEGPSD